MSKSKAAGVSEGVRTSEELAAIEDKLGEIQALSEFILATRILRDGHAANLIEAMAIARDLDRAAALYPNAV